MATGKEVAQAERLAQNAENQRRQDEFGFALAKLEARVSDEDASSLADKTRELHLEALGRDQASQTDNDSSTPDDSVVSEAVKDSEAHDEYVEDGPEDAAYDIGDEEAEVEVSEDVEAEIEAVEE